MAITNVKGGKPSNVRMGANEVSMSDIGELQSLKSEWTPVEIDYDDGQITYTVGDGVIEMVILPSDATLIARLQGMRTGSNLIEATGSDSRKFKSTSMTWVSKPTRFEGNVDSILLRGTKQTATEDGFFSEGS